MEMFEHVTGPSRFCAGMMHNLCALMLAVGESRASIEATVAMVLNNIEEYARRAD